MTRLWHGGIPPSVFRLWKRGLDYLVSTLEGEAWDCMTTCSGTDVDVKCMKALEEYYTNELNIPLRFYHVASCEILEKKQKFLLQEFPDTKFLFDNLCHLTNIKAMDVKSGKPQYVPRTMSNVSGFSCLGRTPLNKNSSKNVGCLQSGTTETGITFHHQAELIIRGRSKVNALENVKELTEKAMNDTEMQEQQSDVEFIIEHFRKHDFSVKMFRFCCTEYGSRVSRIRLYFIIWETRGIPEWLVRECFSLVEAMFFAMRTAPLALDEFLLTDEEQDIWSQHIVDPEKQVDSGGSSWLEKHAEIFPLLGLSWPPDLGELKPVLLPMGLRAAETVFACHFGFQLDADDQWQFMDANSSLERNVEYPPAPGKAMKNPWSLSARTFTSLSKPVIRKRDPDGKITIRQLHAVEQMRMIGWDLGHWRQGPELWSSSVDPALLTSLAGNAFSAFAFTPLWSASLGAYGHMRSKWIQLSTPQLSRPLQEAEHAKNVKTEVETDSDSSVWD